MLTNNPIQREPKLKSVYLRRETFGINEGKFVGEIDFENEYGSVKLNLDTTLSARILEVVSEELVYSARKIAEKLTTNCIDSTAKFENIAARKALDNTPPMP